MVSLNLHGLVLAHTSHPTSLQNCEVVQVLETAKTLVYCISVSTADFTWLSPLIIVVSGQISLLPREDFLETPL